MCIKSCCCVVVVVVVVLCVCIYVCMYVCVRSFARLSVFLGRPSVPGEETKTCTEARFDRVCIYRIVICFCSRRKFVASGVMESFYSFLCTSA